MLRQEPKETQVWTIFLLRVVDLRCATLALDGPIMTCCLLAFVELVVIILCIYVEKTRRITDCRGNDLQLWQQLVGSCTILLVEGVKNQALNFDFCGHF